MEEELVNLNIIDEEDPVEVLGDEIASGEDYKFCLVGQVLMDSVIRFSSMSNTLADLWHPLRRVCIMEIGEKRVLFHFYNEINLNRVVMNVMVHNLPLGFISEGMVRQFGNFIGQFLEYNDMSLRAPSTRVTPTVSKWLREDYRDGSWIGMEVDGDKDKRNLGDFQT
ncbi:hypothetical protein Gorai_007857, partial [Gossypium raimondii]|nr:hypothetical protein [Gossypium raimondii]